jgi:predicted enzyme related to lactoylglutathione lyase
VIVPIVELPPATAFTCQVTLEFELPLTCAVNVCVAPRRTLAALGETVTVTPPDEPDVFPFVDGIVDAQPPKNRGATSSAAKRSFRMVRSGGAKYTPAYASSLARRICNKQLALRTCSGQVKNRRTPMKGCVMANTFGRDILIQAEDAQKAARFYVEQLGFEITDDNPKMIGLAGKHINLYIEPGPPMGPVLEVTMVNVEDAKARLVKNGCTIVKDESEFPRCYVKDPYGLIYNLIS